MSLSFLALYSKFHFSQAESFWFWVCGWFGLGVWVWVWVGTLAPYCTSAGRRASFECSGGLSGSMRPDVHHCCLRDRQVKRMLCSVHPPPPSRSATCSATRCPRLAWGRGARSPPPPHPLWIRISLGTTPLRENQPDCWSAAGNPVPARRSLTCTNRGMGRSMQPQFVAKSQTTDSRSGTRAHNKMRSARWVLWCSTSRSRRDDGDVGFSTPEGGGGGSLEPPKTGGGGFWNRAQLTGPLIRYSELWR